MIRSGIIPLDARIGGFLPGRIQVVAGGIGTGKTTACLQFIAAGLEAGETAAVLTFDRAAELRSHAAFIGFDFDAALRSQRLTALRFRPDFARSLSHAPSPEWILDDLRRLLSRLILPGRLVIDPVTPFLGADAPSSAVIAALVELVERLGTTTLLTYPRPLHGDIDRRLDPLIERAASVLTCERSPNHEFQMVVERARRVDASSGTIPFRIQAGAGIVAVDDASKRVDPEPARIVQIAAAP